jgi:hypothetical protein
MAAAAAVGLVSAADDEGEDELKMAAVPTPPSVTAWVDCHPSHPRTAALQVRASGRDQTLLLPLHHCLSYIVMAQADHVLRMELCVVVAAGYLW